jgi:hypothetical protein
MKKLMNEINRIQRLAGIKLTEDLDSDYTPSYEHIKPYKDKISQAISMLEAVNDQIEDAGPLSEEIVDAIESLQQLASKL